MPDLERGRIVERHELPLDGGGNLLATVAGVDAPQPGRTVNHLAAINRRVVHALRQSEQARGRLELPVRGEWHPEGVEARGVRDLMNRHGRAPCTVG